MGAGERLTRQAREYNDVVRVDFHDYLDECAQLGETDLREYSPLVLAYIGDSIYDLAIRTILVERANCSVQTFHRRASQLVKASAQAQMLRHIEPHLTEEETRVYKRGRNAKAYTVAKNASVADYRVATGFEALMGYLYLKKDNKRLVDLICLGLRKSGASVK